MKNMPYVDSAGRTYSYGEFFPFDISPLAYNQSLAQDFFPLDEQGIREKGYVWKEHNRREFQATMDGQDLPDSIAEVEEKTITKEAIRCEKCSHPYRIIPTEIQFYKRIGLPLPHLCHNCRFIERFKFVNPPKLFHRACMCQQTSHEHGNKCPNEFETSYSPNRPEIVYCESCYQKEVN